MHLLCSHREKGPSLYRGVVGDDHAEPATDTAQARNDACSWRAAVLGVHLVAPPTGPVQGIRCLRRAAASDVPARSGVSSRAVLLPLSRRLQGEWCLPATEWLQALRAARPGLLSRAGIEDQSWNRSRFEVSSFRPFFTHTNSQTIAPWMVPTSIPSHSKLKTIESRRSVLSAHRASRGTIRSGSR